MLRHPTVYAQLLKHYIETYSIQVWLINTGWTNGPYGVGKRFPIETTRQIIRSIQAGKLDQTPCLSEPHFQLAIPQSIPGVDVKCLNPKSGWPKPESYDEEAKKLAEKFRTKLESLRK